MEDPQFAGGPQLEQAGERRLYLAHDRFRQNADQFQGSTLGHRAGNHRQGVLRRRPQGSRLTGETRRGFIDVVGELKRRFPEPGAIETEADKKGFAKLLGEYLRLDNLLQNYDEFTDLKNRQTGDNEALSGFQEGQEEFDHGSDAIAGFRLPSQRCIQDCLSAVILPQ